MQEQKQAYWQLSDPTDAARALLQTVTGIERYQYNRLLRARQNVALYERRPIAGLHPAAYMTVPSPSDMFNSGALDMQSLPMIRGLVNTMVAKIAGRQRPKTQYCVDNSEWSTKRRALRLERFVEAVKQSRHGLRHDAWDVGVMAMRDSCVCDAGCIKVYPDHLAKRVGIERRFPWEVFYDPSETKYGNPQNIFDVYGYDRHQLAARFPEHEEAIMGARPLAEDARGAEDNYTWGEECARQIRVVESYRLRIGDKPGRHMIVVGGTDNPVDLLDGAGEWDRDDFPYLWLRWEQWMIGEYGTSVVDNVASMVTDLNEAVDRWRTAEKLLSGGYIAYEEGTVDPKHLQSNEVGTLIPYKPGAKPPAITVPATLGQASQNWTSLIKSLVYEMSGVSEMSATGSRPEGITAAIAMRTLESQATERFAVQWQEYDRVMSVGMARKIIAAAKELASEDPEFEVRWAQGGKLKTLRWDDVEIDLPDEAITVASVSGLVNTPADRLQLADELHTKGLISNETYLDVIQAKGIASELDSGNAASEWIDEQIDCWLDYEDGKEGFRYRGPLKYLGVDILSSQLVRVGRAFLQADSDDAPDEVLQWFVRFMGDADATIQQLSQRAAALQAAAAGKGPAPQPPA